MTEGKKISHVEDENCICEACIKELLTGHNRLLSAWKRADLKRRALSGEGK